MSISSPLAVADTDARTQRHAASLVAVMLIGASLAFVQLPGAGLAVYSLLIVGLAVVVMLDRAFDSVPSVGANGVVCVGLWLVGAFALLAPTNPYSTKLTLVALLGVAALSAVVATALYSVAMGLDRSTWVRWAGVAPWLFAVALPLAALSFAPLVLFVESVLTFQNGRINSAYGQTFNQLAQWFPLSRVTANLRHVLALGVLLSAMLWLGCRRPIALGRPVVVTSALLVVLSFSRSAWLVAAVWLLPPALLTIWHRGSGRTRRRARRMVAVSSILGVAALLSPIGSALIGRITGEQDFSATRRSRQFDQLVAVTWDNLPGAAGYETATNLPPHNVVLLLGLAAGLVGLVVGLGLVALVLIRGLRALAQLASAGPDRVRRLSALWGMCAFALVRFFTEGSALSNPQIWIAIGAGAALAIDLAGDGNDEPSRMAPKGS